MKEKNRQKRLRLVAEAKKKPAVFTVYIILRLIVVAILVSSILRGEYENAAICLLVLFLFLLPLFVQKKLRHRAAGHAGDHHSGVHLRVGNSGRTGLLFHQCSKLGFHSAHDDGLFCARHLASRSLIS